MSALDARWNATATLLLCFCTPPLPVCSKSDPMVVLLVGDSRQRTWSEVDRSEVVANCLSECGCRDAGGRGACCLPNRAHVPRLPFTLPTLPAADPEFPRPLRCSFDFERLQHMRLVVYDVDVKESDPARVVLSQQDFLGARLFLLLLGSIGLTLPAPNDAASHRSTPPASPKIREA